MGAAAEAVASASAAVPAAAAAAPGVTPPLAGAAAGSAPPTSSAAPAMPVDAWYKDWPEDLRPIGAKYKDAVELAKGHANLQMAHGQLTGGKNIVAVPKDDATPEEVGAFYGKLGRPATAAEYKLPVPEGQPDTLAKAIAPAFHAAGLTQKQAEAVTAGWNEVVAKADTAVEASLKATSETELAAVRATWGQKFDTNIEAIRRLGNETGLAKKGEDGLTAFDKIERAIGTKAFLETFAKLGAPMMDDVAKGMGGGDSGNYAVPMTPESAAAELKSKGQDKEWMARLNRGDPATIAERDTLSAAKQGMSLADWRAAKADLSGSFTQRRRA
jgi:hypothetical protein